VTTFLPSLGLVPAVLKYIGDEPLQRFPELVGQENEPAGELLQQAACAALGIG